MNLKVLGVDLACKSWGDNGTCLLSFETETQSWDTVILNCVRWPQHELTAQNMAKALHQFIRQEHLAGISLDGPQGWREPNAPARPGVGRLCEYEARCQGKTGEYGITFPRPQFTWIKYCIDVFTHLRNYGGRIPTREEGSNRLEPLSGDEFWLIECFPTSIWRTSGLSVLPGKNRCLRNHIDLKPYHGDLTSAYMLPNHSTDNSTHDDLQGLVSALPMAALLGAPAVPVPRGNNGWKCAEGHWVEGLIWDCKPLGSNGNELAENSRKITDAPSADNLSSNPLLIDDRDDTHAEVLSRGVRLFNILCDDANNGKATGCSYGQFVELIFDETYIDLVGRDYATNDTNYVLALAEQVTEEAGGRRLVSRNEVTINVGMDAFIWRKDKPHDRHEKAFKKEPFTKEQWLVIFPDGERNLIKNFRYE